MKISVCFSGHLRTFRKCLPYYKNLFRAHEVKYFMHSWSETSPFESSWHGYNLKPKKVSEKDIYFLKTNLKDIEFIFENQLEIINELDIQKYEIRENLQTSNFWVHDEKLEFPSSEFVDLSSASNEYLIAAIGNVQARTDSSEFGSKYGCPRDE